MKSNNVIMLLLICAAAAGCSSTNGNTSNGPSVPPASIVSITVAPSSPASSLSTIRQFTAMGKYSNNSFGDLTAAVTWSSSHTAVASISNTAGSNGLATALTPGTTTITATSGNITGSTVLTVNSETLVSLVIAPQSPSIDVGTTKQFTVSGTYTDATTQTPSLVTWSSSSTPVATISTTGLATSHATGTTVITASSGTVADSTTLTVTLASLNILPITVNGSLCSAATSANYVNKPCVSVTVCTPGTSTCQIISDILLDTGSYGLRLFKTTLTDVSLTQVASGSGSLAECVSFADGSSSWGPVMTADVILGQEPAVTVPIHVIDATFFSVPAGCGIPDQSPSSAGFNGILGVGLFAEDCGAGCVSVANNGLYYSCSGSTCTGTKVELTSQVQNPVALLPQDNNGVIVQLPAVATGGKISIDGSLILGIGTQSNNTPSGVTTYQADPNTGDFITVFNGITYSQSFIDSGSNALYFSASSSVLTPCTGGNTGWFCPSFLTSLSATNKGYAGTPSKDVTFQIGNADNLFKSSNMVFGELGGSWPGQSFDWGLPFYFGRDVYLGIEGKPSSLGTGPYWAY